MSTAKESIRVCSIFTQWSRQLGKFTYYTYQNQNKILSFSGNILFVQDQFDNSQMSRHWLPPSLTPLLRIAALEFDKKELLIKQKEKHRQNELGVELETTKKNISSVIDSQDKDYQDSIIDLDIILKNAELKSIQLSVQLTALSRRMENIANLDISTNDRVDRLYHRIMESAESLQKSKEKLYINEDDSIIPDQVIDENTKEKRIESPIPNSEKESTFKEHPIVVDEEHTTRTMEKINEKEELQLSDEYQTESIDEARRIIKESDRVSVIKEELEEELEMENDVEPSEQEDTFSIEDELCELRDEISHYLGTDMRNGDDYDRSKKITISQDILWDVIQKVHKFIILFASTRNARCDKWTETNMVHNSEIKDSQQTGNLISSDIFDVTPTNYMKNTEDKSRTQNTTTSNHNKMKQTVKSQTADEKDNASKLKRNNSDDTTGVSYIVTELDTKKAEGKKEHERNLLESHEAELFIGDEMRKYEVQPQEYNVDVLKEDRTHENEDFTDPDKHYIINNESASTRVDAAKIQKLPVIGEQKEDDEMVRELKHQTLTQECDASENIEKSEDTGSTKLRTETIVDKQDSLDSYVITSDTLSNRVISKSDIATDLGTTILDQSKKPKSICEIPLRTYKYKSPPSKKKQKPTDDKKEDTGQDSKDKITLKHPRFQF
uniref:Bromo domain-containing protein n=1 Tax=Heterorhabditis bacteriophora TaxID=37862 RepID=A0A1I7X9N4_HETBA